MFLVGMGLDADQHLGLPLGAEKVGESPLRPQVLFDRLAMPDLGDASHLAMLGLEDREDAGLPRQAGETDRVVARRAPAERARHEDVQVAGAAKRHRVLDLGLEVVQIVDRRGGDVRDLVCHRQPRHVLALAEVGPRLRADRHRRRRAGPRRGRRAALHAGVHVGLVVVADVEHVVVALEHARQAAEADVGRSAVAALGDHANAALLEPGLQRLDLERGGDAGSDRSGVAEQRMDPWQLPRRLRVGRREHLEAAGGVGGDQLVAGRAHRRVDGVARTERLAAALARPVAGVERIVSLDRRLDGALLGLEQAIADGEGAGLIELDELVHQATFAATGADVAQQVLGDRAAAAHLRLALELAVDDPPVEIEEGERLQLVGDRLAQHALE